MLISINLLNAILIGCSLKIFSSIECDFSHLGIYGLFDRLCEYFETCSVLKAPVYFHFAWVSRLAHLVFLSINMTSYILYYHTFCDETSCFTDDFSLLV